MAALQNVTGTAFVVAEFRAEENKETFPLYRDPIVPLFLNDETRKAAERIFASFPPIKKMVRLRTRFLDDQLDSQLRLGYRQIVILGAGLDTRAIRKSAPSVDYFEIDDESILGFKRTVLKENCIDAKVKFISGNYDRDGFVGLLKKYDFNFESPAHFIWEGNTMYLTAAAVSQTLADLTQHVRYFTISFDYMADEVIAKATGHLEITQVVERFASMGATWTYGIRDVRSLAVKAAASILENVKLADLHRVYWPNRPLDSPIYDYYSICTLQSAAS